MGQIKLVHWIMNILPLIHKTEILSTNVSPPLLSNFFSFLFSSTLSINFLSSSCSSTCCAPLLGCSHLIGGCVVNCERVEDNNVSLTWSDMENLVSTQWVSHFTSPCFVSSYVVIDGLRVHEQNLFDMTKFWWVVCADDFHSTISFWIVWVEVLNIGTKVWTFTPWLVRCLCHMIHPSD